MKEIVKVSKNLGTLLIKPIKREIAKTIITQNHYSKKWNSSFGVINYGIYRNNKLLGVAVFGNLMNPKSYSSITELGADSIIELNRLWIDDVLGHNAESILISSSFKLIKHNHPNIKFVQSFADGRLGCGTIYKATNFDYFGYSKSLFFESQVNGETFHKVPLENTMRPLGFLSKNKQYLDNELNPFYVKTYRYIYLLDKKANVLLKKEPYPAYDIGIEEIETYNHSIGLLVRLMIMYNMIGDIDYSIKTLEHLGELGYSDQRISDEIIIQNANDSVIHFRDTWLKNRNNVKDYFKSSIKKKTISLDEFI